MPELYLDQIIKMTKLDFLADQLGISDFLIFVIVTHKT